MMFSRGTAIFPTLSRKAESATLSLRISCFPAWSLNLPALGASISSGNRWRLRDEYDYIILDTPPALSVLTINAYTASDELVIPMLCEILSLQGIAQLKQTIFAVQRYYNKELKVAGILLNKYNPRLTLTKDVEDLANVIAMQLDTKIFKSRISASVSIAEAPAHGESVITYSPKSKAAQEYFAFICELTGEKAGDKS